MAGNTISTAYFESGTEYKYFITPVYNDSDNGLAKYTSICNAFVNSADTDNEINNRRTFITNMNNILIDSDDTDKKNILAAIAYYNVSLLSLYLELGIEAFTTDTLKKCIDNNEDGKLSIEILNKIKNCIFSFSDASNAYTKETKAFFDIFNSDTYFIKRRSSDIDYLIEPNYAISYENAEDYFTNYYDAMKEYSTIMTAGIAQIKTNTPNIALSESYTNVALQQLVAELTTPNSILLFKKNMHESNSLINFILSYIPSGATSTDVQSTDIPNFLKQLAQNNLFINDKEYCFKRLLHDINNELVYEEATVDKYDTDSDSLSSINIGKILKKFFNRVPIIATIDDITAKNISYLIYILLVTSINDNLKNNEVFSSLLISAQYNILVTFNNEIINIKTLLSDIYNLYSNNNKFNIITGEQLWQAKLTNL